MNVPLITWCFILGLIVVIVVVRILCGISHSGKRHSVVHVRTRHSSRHSHFLEMGQESEEFFVPGDPVKNSRDSRIPIVNADEDE